MKFLAFFAFFCATAMANTYECGLMKDSAGNPIPERTKYFVTVPPTTMGELPVQMTLNGIPMLLSSTDGGSTGAVYASNATDVQLYYSIAPAMPGVPTFAVAVHKMVKGDDYRASCPGNPMRVNFQPAQGNSGMCYEMPDCEGGSLGVMNASSCSGVGRSWLDESDGSCSNF